MNYLTIEILERFPQLYKITPEIFTETCKEVLNTDIDYNKSWLEQGILDELDLVQVILNLEDKLNISIDDDLGNKIIELTNNPPDFRIVNRINNLNKLLP
jgi:acyl carrier protein